MNATPLTKEDIAAVRDQFRALGASVNGAKVVYLDTASTAQKPACVIAAVVAAYEASANIHRGVHAWSVRATDAYESVRAKVATLIGARDPREVIFTRGTTEAVNLVAQSFGGARVGHGDEIVVSELEHHSNILPWQRLAEEKGARIRVLPVDDRGDVVLDALSTLLSARTRIVAVTHVSNAIGTVLPVAEISRRARAVGAFTVVDGAQAVAHRRVDVAALGCDFYAFSGHKLYAPTGSGVLWGRRELLESMSPWQRGGDMVLSVSFDETTFHEVPHRFEAGTPDIAAVIGLGAAIDWISAIGLDRIAAREASLLRHARRALDGVPALRFFGDPREHASVLSFNVDDLHPHDVGTALDLEGVAVRTGHHCTQPLMRRFGIDATVRASLGVYTTEEELSYLADALGRAHAMLRRR